MSTFCFTKQERALHFHGKRTVPDVPVTAKDVGMGREVFDVIENTGIGGNQPFDLYLYHHDDDVLFAVTYKQRETNFRLHVLY